MGEFEKADRDDWELEKAQDKVDREHDRDYLYDFDTRVEDWEAAWRAERKAQAARSDALLPRVCPICHGRWTVVVAGPDENGLYDTDDCPCQKDLYGR